MQIDIPDFPDGSSIRDIETHALREVAKLLCDSKERSLYALLANVYRDVGALTTIDLDAKSVKAYLVLLLPLARALALYKNTGGQQFSYVGPIAEWLLSGEPSYGRDVADGFLKLIAEIYGEPIPFKTTH